MIQITEENRPRCFKPDCDEPAITLINKMWLCGKHLIELQNKLDKLKKDILLEE
jgi:hypothetical protein